MGGNMVNINDRNENNITSPMLTIKEVAKLLHVHSNTARRWADSGIIHAYRISRRGDRRFRRADILKFLTDMNDNNGAVISK
jgi:excisionase family DNA binding protein